MSLVGYVSDERYLALGDVLVEFERDGGRTVVRSGPGGAIDADIAPGSYRVTLARDGYGPKRVTVDVGPGRPIQFRLLSNRIVGYVWPKWVRSGERSEFRVHSPEPYRLSLWRCGERREFVRLIGWFDEHGPRATMQVTPDGDYTQGGVEFNRRGFGNTHNTQLTVGPERSGLYYFHAEGESGAFFAFPWVVAPDRPRSDIAVLASTNTWNAYNSFGGRSNYIHPAGLPPEPTANARLDLRRYQEESFAEWGSPDSAYLPLSFERPEPNNQVGRDEEPTDPIRGRQPCHLAAAEWRLLAWLERERYAYDFYADADLHAGRLDLDAYRVLIISTHPEYWSGDMYRAVKAWVNERGGRLMYLGGNGLNCEVEFLDEATLKFNNLLVSTGGDLGGVDPNDPSRRLESRFHRRFESEANLLGVVCSASGIMTAAPYRVIEADHWVFEGTGLAAGDTFGAASLHERIPGGASGHETDKMSASSPPGTRLLAKGLNPDDGGSEIVHYATATGGEVFSVGSITWPACVLVDDAVSQVTRNVLERFLAR